jgi:mercuric ion binding protein
MRKLVFMMMSLMAFTTIANAQSASENKGIQEIKIKTSAVCDMCKETLEKAMAYEKGVKKSTLDVDSKILTVSYDPKKTSPEKIKKAITIAGYDADEMHANDRAYENLNPCCKKDAKH